MSYIEELRQRVETAEKRFGLIDEQQRRYSERLIGLMNALEAGQEERQAEAAAHAARVAELERENGELRGMLHALLLGVEAGSRDMLADTLRDLDSRLSTMVRPAADAVGMAADEPLAEAPADEALPEAPIAESLVAEELIAEESTAGDPMAEDSMAEDPIAEDPMAEDPTAEDSMAEDPMAEAPAEDAGADATDPVIAAEQAVADLLAGSEGGAELDELVAEAAAIDEAPAEMEIAGGAEGEGMSPVAEMMDRLADETQDFAEPELAFEEIAEAPAAEPAPARKKA